jgi:hypothetical protein
MPNEDYGLPKTWVWQPFGIECTDGDTGNVFLDGDDFVIQNEQGEARAPVAVVRAVMRKLEERIERTGK